MPYFFKILGLFLLLHNNVYAQEAGISPIKDSSINAFGSARGNSFLFFGREYDSYKPGIKGDPFFMTGLFQKGSLMYSGVVYEDVPMIFDMVRQVIVINQYRQALPMQLLTEKITWFQLSGHHFQVLTQAMQEDGAGTGLYDVIYSGKISVLVKRVKVIKRSPKPEDPNYFEEEDNYFIKNGQTLYSANNKEKLLQALEGKSAAMKLFITKNKLKFKKNIEQDLIVAGDYYSSLN